MKTKIKIIILLIFLFFLAPHKVSAALLSASPPTGSFSTGSTFEVAVYLDTDGEVINTVSLKLNFPPDKLQLISPTSGKSIISIWTKPPQFNNQTGVVTLEGGLPGGIQTSRGLITTLTFRVNAVGQALIKFSDSTRVLLNDGKGTDALRQSYNAIYDLVLPPPAGPVVVSETHPDQTLWYSRDTAILRWIMDEDVASNYSYMLNKKPVDIPDNIAEEKEDGVIYRELADGHHYFHIKALREGIWGGTTHFALNIDTEFPAEFPIEIMTSEDGETKNPIIQFVTTDSLSGVDHYEMKIVSLDGSMPSVIEGQDQPLFFEVTSPYVAPELEINKYDIIIRAYDKAGNFREMVERFKVKRFWIKIIKGKGVLFFETVLLSWWQLILLLIIIITIIGSLALYIRHLHKKAHKSYNHYVDRKKVSSGVNKKIKELENLKEKYEKMTKLFLGLFLAGSMFTFYLALPVKAEQVQLSPPLITTISKNVTNEEIFYVGGKTETQEVEITIYLQNAVTGETFEQETRSDARGDWFYRHDSFLPSGEYIIWAQSQMGEQQSPPSPQEKMTIDQTALQIGASRISYSVFYLTIIGILTLVLITLIVYTIYHFYQLQHKKRRYKKEIREAERAVVKGFDKLRADIQSELKIIKKMKLGPKLSQEEKILQEKLLKDLEEIEKRISKEVGDISEV